MLGLEFSELQIISPMQFVWFFLRRRTNRGRAGSSFGDSEGTRSNGLVLLQGRRNQHSISKYTKWVEFEKCVSLN